MKILGLGFGTQFTTEPSEQSHFGRSLPFAVKWVIEKLSVEKTWLRS